MLVDKIATKRNAAMTNRQRNEFRGRLNIMDSIDVRQSCVAQEHTPGIVKVIVDHACDVLESQRLAPNDHSRGNVLCRFSPSPAVCAHVGYLDPNREVNPPADSICTISVKELHAKKVADANS